MSTELAGKVALVTGSGRGLGFAIAAKLAECGADVVVHDLNRESPARYGEAATVDDAAEAISRRWGVRSLAVTGDLSHPDAAQAIAADVRGKMGWVEILVNCAGGDIGAGGGKPDPNDALHIAYEDIMALVNNNFVTTLLACQAFCPDMAERGAGTVINIASAAAHFGTSPEVVYSALKAAVVHYTRCLAFEMTPYGVRVNAVSPGPTKTARFVSTRPLDPAMSRKGRSLNRYGEPEEIAEAVAFLAGPRARFVHGQVLRADGGMTLYAG